MMMLDLHVAETENVRGRLGLDSDQEDEHKASARASARAGARPLNLSDDIGSGMSSPIGRSRLTL